MALFKKLTVSSFFVGLQRVLINFWPTVICAVLAVVFYILAIEAGYKSYIFGYHQYDLRQWGTSANFGLAATLAWSMILVGFSAFRRNAYRTPPSPIIQQALNGLGLLLPIGFYILIPENGNEWLEWTTVRMILAAAAAHLAVAVGPYLFGGSERGFWQWNRILFLRILTTILYSGVLIAGVELAMLASEYLLKFDWDEGYFKVAVFIGIGFSALFFSAGIPQTPDEIRALEPEHNTSPYPNGLKVFTQFVLLPLVGLYLVILYAYGARLAIIQAWPEGWVSTLIFSYSVAGILAFLLVWPLQQRQQRQKRNKPNPAPLDDAGHAIETAIVEDKYASLNRPSEAANSSVRSGWFGNLLPRLFDLALIPLLALEFAAIGIRVQAYGITEERYIGLMMAGWLAFLVTVRLLTKGRLIRFIPASLLVVVLWTAFSPWNARETTRASQLNEYTDLLTKSKVLKNGKAVPLGRIQSGDTIPERDLGRIGLLTEYMLEKRFTPDIAPMFSRPLSDTLMSKGENILKEADSDDFDYDLQRRTEKLILKDFGLIPEEVKNAEYAASNDNISSPRNKDYDEDGELKSNSIIKDENVRPRILYAEVLDTTKMIEIEGARYLTQLKQLFVTEYYEEEKKNEYRRPNEAEFDGLKGPVRVTVDTDAKIRVNYQEKVLIGTFEEIFPRLRSKVRSETRYPSTKVYLPTAERKIALRDKQGKIQAYFYINSLGASFLKENGIATKGRVTEVTGTLLFMD